MTRRQSIGMVVVSLPMLAAVLGWALSPMAGLGIVSLGVYFFTSSS